MFIPEIPDKPSLFKRIKKWLQPSYWHFKWKFRNGFKKIKVPITRMPWTKLKAEDIVNVQPMMKNEEKDNE